jgi:hypothetical protein
MAQTKPSEMSLEDIAGTLGNSKHDSPMYNIMTAELARRQTAAQVDAAKYMAWSVLAIAVTSGLNALFAFLLWYAPHSN